VLAPNGDTFVDDGHGANTNDRVVKFNMTGKQIATWADMVIESRRTGIAAWQQMSGPVKVPRRRPSSNIPAPTATGVWKPSRDETAGRGTY
jgi:hypothetical protein